MTNSGAGIQHSLPIVPTNGVKSLQCTPSQHSWSILGVNWFIRCACCSIITMCTGFLVPDPDGCSASSNSRFWSIWSRFCSIWSFIIANIAAIIGSTVADCAMWESYIQSKLNYQETSWLHESCSVNARDHAGDAIRTPHRLSQIICHVTHTRAGRGARRAEAHAIV